MTIGATRRRVNSAVGPPPRGVPAQQYRKRNMKATEYVGDLTGFLNEYDYQPQLTQRLDSLNDIDFTQQLVNEIVLWKVNRYVSLDGELLRSLNELRTLVIGEHRKGEAVLIALINAHGVDLAMASTLLRFRNPSTFQIIDRHAYRAVYGRDYSLYSTSPVSRKVSVYFGYLDELVALCNKQGLDYRTVDRLLYVFDKEKNGKL